VTVTVRQETCCDCDCDRDCDCDCAAGDVLFTVHQSESGAGGLTLDLATGTVLDSWSAAKGFYTPHDLAVSSDGRTIYVAETTPARLYKFLVEPNFYQEV